MRPIIVLSKDIADEVEALNIDLTHLESTEQKPSEKKSTERELYTKLLLNLSQGNRGAMNEEFLKRTLDNNTVCSLRFTQGIRIIAIKINIDGKAITFLKFKDKHDAAYKKADYLDKIADKDKQQIARLAAKATEGSIVTLKNKRTALTPKPVCDEPDADGAAGVGGPVGEETIEDVKKWLYQKRSFTPTTTQQECLDRLLQGLQSCRPFAALVAGAPGAGKTLLAFQLLELLGGKIWYTTESDTLRTNIKEVWQASPYYAKDKVKFLNYQDIVLRVDTALKDLTAVDDDDIIFFFDGLKGTYFQKKSSKKVSAEQFRQECYVMACCDSLEEYQSIGRKHSQFQAADTELKLLLWTLYQSYNKGLTEDTKYHPKLRKLTLEDTSADCENMTIIVDEACDLSLVQLKNLVRLGAKIAFFGDHNQDAIFNSNLISYIDQQIAISYKGSDQRYVTLLDVSYRCSPEVATVASNALALTNKLQKQHLSELVQKSISSGLAITGNIRLANQSEVKEAKALLSTANTAVIYMDGDDAAKKQAEKIFPEESIYSISEIKGLEFKRIILWNVISNATASGIDKHLKLSEKKVKSKLSQDKLAKRLKYLFIAITRAEVELIIMQNNLTHPSVQALCEKLAPNGATSEYFLDLEDAELSNDEQWLNLADKHYKTDEHIDRANRIYAKQIQPLIKACSINEAFNIMLRQTAQADKLYQAGKIDCADDIYQTIALYLPEDSEELKIIKLHQIDALNGTGQTEKAKAIRATLSVPDETDRDDVEEKVSPPSSPRSPEGGAEKKTVTPPIEPLCSKTGAIGKAEDAGSKARATAIEPRIDDYLLQFTTGTGQNKSRRRKGGTKNKLSKTKVTFNKPLGQTQINVIISCIIESEITNITAQHLAALLCTNADTTISNEKYDELILKILSKNRPITDSLAREIQTLLAAKDITGTVLLNMLKTKQPHFYIHCISAIVELAKTNDTILDSLVNVLTSKDELSTTLLQLEGVFSQLIPLAQFDTAILTAMLESFNPAICMNVITTDPSNFVKWINFTKSRAGYTKPLLKALNKTTSGLPSALLYALRNTTCALPTIELLKENPDAIPEDILVPLFTLTKEKNKLIINDCPTPTLEAFAKLAIIKPRICARLLDTIDQRGGKFEESLSFMATHSKQGYYLITEMAKHNKQLLEEIISSLSFQNENRLTSLHQLATFFPELFMAVVKLVLNHIKDTELTSALTICPEIDGCPVTPLNLLLNCSKPTMLEFIALAPDKPALYNALIQTFELESPLIFISTMDPTNNDYRCLIAFLNLANSHDDFCDRLTKNFKYVFEHKPTRTCRIDALCRVINNYFEVFPPFLEFCTKNEAMLKLFNEILITTYDDDKKILLHVSAYKPRHLQYFASLFEQAKHSQSLYTTMLEGMKLKSHERTPLYLLARSQPDLLYNFIDYTLTHKSAEEHAMLMAAMSITTDKKWTILHASLDQKQTKLFELAEKHHILKKFITGSLLSQDLNYKWTIVHMVAYYLPNYIKKIVEFCDASSEEQNRLLDALPLSTTMISGKPAVESGLQMIAERAGELPLKCIINFIIKNIQSAEEERCGKAIELLANFIQRTYNKGNTGLHYIIYADSSCELYEAVLAIAKTETTLQSALDVVTDTKNLAGTSPNQLMALLPKAYTDHYKLFKAVLTELAEGKEVPQESTTTVPSRAT